MLGVALLAATPTFSATTDDNDNGTKQTLTVNNEKIERTVSEIRIDGNNAVLLFSDNTTITADMRLVTLTMSYDETTEVKEVNGVKGVNDNSYYTLDGIKVTLKPRQNGIYIHNGKKIVNKKK
jgi:hypothetical protein